MRAIVLSSVRYTDSQRVFRFFTEQYGLKSYLVRKQKARSGSGFAVLHPFALLEIREHERQRGQLSVLKEFHSEVVLNGLVMQAEKSAVAMFGAELLARCLADNQAHQELFQTVWSLICQLDLDEQCGVYTFLFAGRIIRYLGLMPLHETGIRSDLDLRSGQGTDHGARSEDLLRASLVPAFVMAGSCTASAFREIKLNREEQRELLRAMVAFLQLHVAGTSPINSLEVLRTVYQ